MATRGGFSVDGSVRIRAVDRAGCERLRRDCARPPFALDRLRELDPERLFCESFKRGPGGNGPQILTPLQILDRLADLVPPPLLRRARTQRTAARCSHRPRSGRCAAAACSKPDNPPRNAAIFRVHRL